MDTSVVIYIYTYDNVLMRITFFFQFNFRTLTDLFDMEWDMFAHDGSFTNKARTL